MPEENNVEEENPEDQITPFNKEVANENILPVRRSTTHVASII